MAILSRAWQLLLKGLEEGAVAPNQAAAAEMVLIRLAYTADLPPPDDIIKALGGDTVGQRSGKTDAPAAGRTPSAAPVSLGDPGDGEDSLPEDGPLDYVPDTLPVARSFEEVVELTSKNREAKLKVHLEEHVSLVKFDPAGSIELHLLPGAPKELANELREKLNAWTGRRWMVALSNRSGALPLGQLERERKAREISALKEHPAVAAVLKQFPDAEITSVQPLPQGKTDDTGTG
jgi:DNA polymerase-3 subunit gamma/tau